MGLRNIYYKKKRNKIIWKVWNIVARQCDDVIKDM